LSATKLIALQNLHLQLHAASSLEILLNKIRTVILYVLISVIRLVSICLQ